VGRTTPAPPKGPSRCVSSSLRASLGQSEGTAGSIYTALVLTNRGSVACTLDGYPGVSFTAGTDAHQVGSPAKRDNRYRAALLLLAPGATAHTTVKVADHSAYDPATCLAVPANGFRIYPPGSLLVRAPQQVCSKPGVQGFEKSAVRRGTVAD